MCAGAISPKDAPAQSPGCAGSHGRGTLGGCARACSACARASAQPATSAQCFLVCSTVHPSFLTPVDICPDHQGADGAGELRACAVCAARQGSGAWLFQTKPSARGRRRQWRWRRRQRRWQAARGQGQRLRVNDQRGARSSTFQTQLLLAFRVQVTIRLERCKPFVCCGGTAALARR